MSSREIGLRSLVVAGLDYDALDLLRDSDVSRPRVKVSWHRAR